MLRDRVALLVRMSVQSQRNPGTQAVLKNELASLRHHLQTIEDLVAKEVWHRSAPLANRAGCMGVSICFPLSL